MPAELNIDLTCLQKVDSLINDAIKQKAFPGCQVYASVDGKVIYNKSFGFTTYADTQAVENDMIYDIAGSSNLKSEITSNINRLGVFLEQLNNNYRESKKKVGSK